MAINTIQGNAQVSTREQYQKVKQQQQPKKPEQAQQPQQQQAPKKPKETQATQQQGQVNGQQGATGGINIIT